MARERRVFSEEFKCEAVKLVGRPGASKAAIARDLGIGANLLGRWCRDANVDAEVAVGREKVSAQEYERMRRELAKVKMERDILKNRPTRLPVALMNRNSGRVHWWHAESVAVSFLEA
ncbi:transposase [Duganella sp. CF517]|uniref:transposase n=1 Tax=Duganella sp. CF517 TaxID=1881038 RepID=UPI000B7D3867